MHLDSLAGAARTAYRTSSSSIETISDPYIRLHEHPSTGEGCGAGPALLLRFSNRMVTKQCRMWDDVTIQHAERSARRDVASCCFRGSFAITHMQMHATASCQELPPFFSRDAVPAAGGAAPGPRSDSEVPQVSHETGRRRQGGHTGRLARNRARRLYLPSAPPRSGLRARRQSAEARAPWRVGVRRRVRAAAQPQAVSYTHLTLPTICSV